MTTEQIDDSSASRSATTNEDVAIEGCWTDLIKLTNDRTPLDQIFAAAEKLIQYYRLKNPQHIEQLRARIATKQQAVAAEIAAGVDEPSLKRLQAGLAGASAGCVYPLGWSPRDLNQMAF